MLQESLDKVREQMKNKPTVPAAGKKLVVKKNFGIRPSGLKKPPEVWQGMLYQGKVGILAGESKSHKTWAALGLGLSVAAGRPYWNHATTKSKVLYVDLEIGGVFLEQDRIQPIMEALNITPEEIDGYWDVLDCEGNDESAGTLIESIADAIEQEKYGLVIIDPYYMLALGLDENSNSEMALVAARLNKLAKQIGSSLLIVHHYPKGSQSGKPVHERGSGAGVIAGRNPSVSLGLSGHAEVDCYILDGVWRHHEKSDKMVLRWKYPLLVPDADLNPDNERSRGKSKEPPLEDKHLFKAFEQPRTKKGGMRYIRDELGKKFEDCNFRVLLEKCERNGFLSTQIIKKGRNLSTVYMTNPSLLNGATDDGRRV
jgi:hypothetical protein